MATDTTHLVPVQSARGFAHLPTIRGTSGEHVRAYESSAADSPHIWLSISSPANRNKPDEDLIEAVAHLPVDEARKVAEQILQLCDNHYQGYLR